MAAFSLKIAPKHDTKICYPSIAAVTAEMGGFLLLGQGPVEQSSTNKPLAMRVVEDALAYSKKPPVI